MNLFFKEAIPKIYNFTLQTIKNWMPYHIYIDMKKNELR